LSEQGIISTSPDPDDRRSAIVSLTDAGREHFAALADAHSRWVHEALSCFPAEEQVHLLALLDQLKTSIRAQ
jgi:DNA-binding MarR family transcriptional regulator